MAFNFDYIASIVHNRYLRNLDDIVSYDTTVPIVYTLKPTHLRITQLQGELQQMKVDPNSKFDPPSRRPSVDSTSSLPTVSPEIMA